MGFRWSHAASSKFPAGKVSHSHVFATCRSRPFPVPFVSHTSPDPSSEFDKATPLTPTPPHPPPRTLYPPPSPTSSCRRRRSNSSGCLPSQDSSPRGGSCRRLSSWRGSRAHRRSGRSRGPSSSHRQRGAPTEALDGYPLLASALAWVWPRRLCSECSAWALRGGQGGL